jgi:hypothetical protein
MFMVACDRVNEVASPREMGARVLPVDGRDLHLLPVVELVVRSTCSKRIARCMQRWLQPTAQGTCVGVLNSA